MKVGDVVRIQAKVFGFSGVLVPLHTRTMMVYRIHGDIVECAWFDDLQFRCDAYPIDWLVILAPEAVASPPPWSDLRDGWLRRLVDIATGVHPTTSGQYDLGKDGYQKLVALVREITSTPRVAAPADPICNECGCVESAHRSCPRTPAARFTSIDLKDCKVRLSYDPASPREVPSAVAEQEMMDEIDAELDRLDASGARDRRPSHFFVDNIMYVYGADGKKGCP